MAGGGVGEAALIGAALGGTTSAMQGGDPLKGAMLGGLTGGAGAGMLGAMGGGAAGSAAGSAGAASGALGAAGMGPTGAVLDAALAGGAPAAASPGIMGALGSMSPMAKMATGAVGLGALGAMSDRNRFGVPEMEKYDGPLSRYQFDPSRYRPYEYKPYAAGGPVQDMSQRNAMGAAANYPMANVAQGAYATPYQQPYSSAVVSGPQDAGVNMFTGEQVMAGGGIADLGGYSDGGRLLKGPGDGVSDSIPAVIGGKRPARLADGEFVVPARIVSELGNGSTDAGARELYKMMERVQAGRGKTVGKGRVAKDTKASKHLPA